MVITSGIRAAGRAERGGFGLRMEWAAGPVARSLVAAAERALRIARRSGAVDSTANRCPGVMRGELVAEDTIQPLPGATPMSRCVVGLTGREVEVLRLLATGRSNHQIAAALGISPHTVHRHVANVYLKIDAHNRAEATAYALRHGLA